MKTHRHTDGLDYDCLASGPCDGGCGYQARAEVQAALAADYKSVVLRKAESASTFLATAANEVAKMLPVDTPIDRYREKVNWVLVHLVDATDLLEALKSEIKDHE